MMILLRDFLKDFLRNLFGEEMGGGQGDPDPLVLNTGAKKKGGNF